MKGGADKITDDDANSEAKMRKKMKEDEVNESALEEKSGRIDDRGGAVKVDIPQVVKVDKKDDMAKESVAKAKTDSSAKADSSPLTPVVCSRVNDTGSKPVSFTFHFN